MPTKDPAQVRIKILSNPLFLSGTREFIAAVARRLGFPEEACGQMALAVDEALCNVIRHGYDREADKPIWITLYPLRNGAPVQQPENSTDPTLIAELDALRIVIEDNAQQVDPGTIRSRDLDQIRPGGLGVHIIQAVMDDVVYEAREEGGMRLTLTKHLTTQNQTAGPEHHAPPAQEDAQR